MDLIIAGTIGLFIGNIFGFMVAALCVANNRYNEED